MINIVTDVISANDVITQVLMLLGGIGALVLAFKLLSDNIEKMANSGLKKLFNKTSSNPLIGVGIGASVTAIIQSSGATTVMIVGFVNAGIMSLAQATAIIMGANIGTTITAHIVSLSSLSGLGSFDFKTFAIALTFLGAFMDLLSKKDKVKTIGLAIAGLGLVFLALDIMSGSMKFLQSLPALQNFLSMCNNPILLLLFGIIFTAAIQSSSASTSIVIMMLSAGAVIGSPESNAPLYIILGSNIGSCVTALMSSINANTNAKRASLIHLMFNTFGTLIWLIICLCVPNLMKDTLMRLFPGNPATQIAWFHTFFNVGCTILFLPFIKVFVKVATLIMPDKKKESKQESFIDDRFLETPAIALAQVSKELIRFGGLCMDTLDKSITCFINKDTSKEEEILENIADIEGLNQDILEYLIKLSGKSISREDETIISKIHQAVNDFYREAEIADNMVKYTKSEAKKEMGFSPIVYEQIGILQEKLNQQFTNVKLIFDENKKELISLVDQVEDEIDTLRSSMIKEHIKRLEEGVCKPTNSGTYINLVSNLERAGDHLAYVAHSMVD